MKKVTLLAASVLAGLMSAQAFASGDGALYRGDASYFRTGVANKNMGGDENKVGRLGNQTDTYLELAPNFTLAEVDGTTWTYVGGVAYKSANYNGSWQEVGDNVNLAFVQSYMKVSGLLDFDKDAVVWVGKKYNREDSHVVDQYWRNTSGNGVGVENLSLGSGKFAAHWVRQDVKGKWTNGDDQFAMTNNIFDVAYSFPISSANLELRYNHLAPQGYSSERKGVNSTDYKAGDLFTVKLGLPVLNGWNNTVIRFAKGGAANWAGPDFGNDMANCLYSTTTTGAAYAYDALNYGAVNFTDRFGMLYHIRGTIADRKTATYNKSKMFQAVLRPSYALTKMTKIMLEGGYYTLSSENPDGSKNANSNMSKVTLAYAINPDAYNVWTRPEIRFYVTWKHYGHDDAKASFGEGAPGKTNQVFFGAQAEAWF